MRNSAGTVNRASEAPARATIRVGDRVRWNDRYSGKVASVNGSSAVIIERDNRAFGRPIRWRLVLSALTVVDDDDEQAQ